MFCMKWHKNIWRCKEETVLGLRRKCVSPTRPALSAGESWRGLNANVRWLHPATCQTQPRPAATGSATTICFKTPTVFLSLAPPTHTHTHTLSLSLKSSLWTTTKQSQRERLGLPSNSLRKTLHPAPVAAGTSAKEAAPAQPPVHNSKLSMKK